MEVKEFIRKNYRHFNAAVLADAAEGWCQHLKAGGKMFLAMGGAMSTGEIGISLGTMIRNDKVHAVSCTGANLEEDIFNLIAHDSYKRIANYRSLSAQDELNLRDASFNRVTDTCIPEEAAMLRVESKLIPLWEKAESEGKRYFPYEYLYQLLRSGCLREYFQVDPKYSWVMAACERNIPIFTPGWEDSTLGNALVAAKLRGRFKNHSFVKNGFEQMEGLVDWCINNSESHSVGFFQIGGGIAGDFAICAVPLIRQDLKQECKMWGYYCQISDSTTSYGSYSGAVPNEKITWGKLGVDTPKFIIESDASIVAPLIFQYVLSKFE
ncbi:MAG: deoxyhypusine synthase family protein [Candidatus Omnitrophica bacterium]|nr:deoxyhypusine synthase family protein [Candidatus Omnitrophota bacterium]MDD5670741.1 deoxyhypusine synthase family protein [Candidatus Omnitrophota bacterium]